MEFLSRSWSVPSLQVSRAIAPPASPEATAAAGSIPEDDITGEHEEVEPTSVAGNSFSFASAATLQLVLEQIMSQSAKPEYEKVIIKLEDEGKNKDSEGRVVGKSGNPVLKSVAGVATMVCALVIVLYLCLTSVICNVHCQKVPPGQIVGPIHPFHPKITVRRGVLATELVMLCSNFSSLGEGRIKNQNPHHFLFANKPW